MQELQNNNIEQEKCKKDPVYFYNTYIRKEGQPILSKEEYDRLMREIKDAGYVSPIRKRDGSPIHMREYPLRPGSLQEDYMEATDGMIKVLSKKDIVKGCRLFYEIVYSSGRDRRGTGEFKEIVDVEEFLKSDTRLEDTEYIRHHNFHIIKTKDNG